MACIDLIIPIYNREKYIPRLLEALEQQTMKDFHVIFVDDGSVDDSLAVLKMKLKDTALNYQIIEKENGGAASARNAGLRAAKAKWIAFMDSDDGLLPNFLEYMYTAAENTQAEVCMCGFQLLWKEKNMAAAPVERLEYSVITPADAMRAFYQHWVGAVCLLVKQEFQKTSGLWFDEACVYHEDIPFVTEVIEAAHCVARVHGDLYLYFAEQGTLSRCPSKEKYRSGIACFEKTVRKMEMKNSEAARVFRQVGQARYYIATLRKMAVQMPYPEFLDLAREIDFCQYKTKLSNLSLQPRLAAYVFCVSKLVFYYLIRLFYTD